MTDPTVLQSLQRINRLFDKLRIEVASLALMKSPSQKEIDDLEDQLRRTTQAAARTVAEIDRLGLSLTSIERTMLGVLLEANGRVVTYDDLLAAIYYNQPEESWPVSSSILSVRKHWLNKKLKAIGMEIKTDIGVGYRI